MSTIILGSNGMLGHMLSKYFKDAATLAKKDADIKIDITKDFNLTLKILKNFKIIINCIGILVDKSETNKKDAILINSYFPKLLENTFIDTDIKIIHISTDCIFNGTRGNYSVDEFSNSVSFYGKTKYLGEINNFKDLTLRTSIIGPEISNHRTGLLNWFLNEKEVDGYANVFWNGVTTLELAEIINYCIENNVSGLHQVGNVKISKYDLLLKIKEIYNLDTKINKTWSKFNDKSLIHSLLNYKVPPYEDQLIKLKAYGRI